MKTKKCTRCGIEKPLDAEHYHKDSRKSSGLVSQCKVCQLKQKAEYYQNNKEKFAQKNAEYNREKNLEQPACVYQIVNTVNNKVYIGQTTQGELRWKRHASTLRGNYHKNHKLQADFNRFGEDAFEWSIIKEYPKDKDTLLLEEARTIVKYRKEGKQLYNIRPTENK